MKQTLILGTTPLDRKELKKVRGGGALEPPGTPTGGGTGAAGRWKCCFNNAPFICSECVPCNPNCLCQSDSFLVFCGP